MAKSKTNQTIKLLKIIVVLLVIVIAALAFYIVYPSVQLGINGQPYGQRLSGINSPLTSFQLSTINNASESNFENAGNMLLNGTIPGEVTSGNTINGPLFEMSLNPTLKTATPLVINGKPSVVYIGAISCIYCGENRWAMALALSRFGTFNSLYTGYSSIGDSDVPTLYWLPQNTTTAGAVKYGNDYSSQYINFISAEWDSPITAGFQLPNSPDPISIFVANATNSSYSEAMMFMNSSQIFQGTPFTFWGTSFNAGADAVVFGNGTSQSEISNHLPLTYMSHQQIFQLLHGYNSTFAYEEYAAADLYVAETCPAINNTAQICSLPAIKQIESRIGA